MYLPLDLLTPILLALENPILIWFSINNTDGYLFLIMLHELSLEELSTTIISDFDTCEICANPKRDNSIICVVEDIRDVMAIESTSSFKGLYHVLGGKISPMDGIGPDDLNITSLVDKVKSGVVKELIFALSSTMEGDTTNFYIYKLINKFEVLTSTIARGVSVGDDLEYADEITLGRSITNRIPFESSIKI